MICGYEEKCLCSSCNNKICSIKSCEDCKEKELAFVRNCKEYSC